MTPYRKRIPKAKIRRALHNKALRRTPLPLEWAKIIAQEESDAACRKVADLVRIGPPYTVGP